MSEPSANTPDTSQSPQSPDGRATSFQAVQSPTEHYSGEVLLVSAYAVLWVILLAWVAYSWRKQSLLNARLDDLEREVDKAASAADAKSTSLRT